MSKPGLNFSPYSEPPDHTKAGARATPPEAGPSSGGGGVQASSSSSSYQAGGAVESLNQDAFSSDGAGRGPATGIGSHSFGAGYSTAVQPGDYETRFGWRCDMMAAFAYLLGPLSAIPLLLLETHNNFVRFHAYQALFLSITLGFLHLFLLWSRFLTRTMVVVDIGVALYQARNTYIDADSLRRRFLPYFGEIANSWVEEE